MFRPFSLFVGLRYTRAKRRNHFISFISLISILGITLGVTALITVLSVMNGFEKELRERILGMASHASISGYDGQLDNWRILAGMADQHPEVLGAAPYVQGEGMLTLGSQVSGVMVRGILPSEEPKVSDVGEKMNQGELSDLHAGEFGIILGKDLARGLGVLTGDKVTLVAPQPNVTPAGILPRLKRFTVVGIFEVGMYEYDSTMALVHMQDAAKLFRLGQQVSGVRLKLSDMFKAQKVSGELVEDLPGGYFVTDWTRQHANFFRAIKIEKTVMFVILLLIVAVAAFNIISTMMMVVTDKEADIAILRTLGTSPAGIMAIFMVQGTFIGILGTCLGTVGGMILALNIDTIVPTLEGILGFKFLAPDVYYISDLPSDMRGSDVLKIASMSFFLSLVATLYPAWSAARVQPAEALRYE